MYTSILLFSSLFTTLSLAQLDHFNIDTAEEGKVVSDAEKFVATLTSSPVFQTDVAAIISAVPASILAEASSDPEALLAELASDDETPDWVSAIPTSVISNLETLAAKPIKAAADVEAYLESFVDDPKILNAVGALETAVPTSVQDAIENDPVTFLEGLVTATALPPWVSNIPAPVQSEIGSVVNGALSIVASDLEGTATALPTSALKSLSSAASGYIGKGGFATGTAGAGSVGGGSGSNGTVATKTPAPSPSTFTSEGAMMKTLGVGVAALIAGAGLFLAA